MPQDNTKVTESHLRKALLSLERNLSYGIARVLQNSPSGGLNRIVPKGLKRGNSFKNFIVRKGWQSNRGK